MAAASLSERSARAQGAEKPSRAPQESSVDAVAEALFREGRQLFDDRRYDEACPKLAASIRIQPATGALLALAACHEAEGKTASAWLEYNEVVARALRESRSDRATAAQQRAAALEPKLSRMTVVLAPGASDIAGLVVRFDGAVLAADAFGTSVPVDPGEHTVDATAPERLPWSTHANIAADGSNVPVTVPVLVPVTFAAPPPAADVPATAGPPLRTIGIATGAAGLVAIGLGAYFGLRAMAKNDDSESDCAGDVCGPAGKQQRLDALAASRASTVAFVAGGVLVAGGVALFVWGGRDNAKQAVGVSAATDLRSSAVVFGGRF
jgi:hypothetical protein